MDSDPLLSRRLNRRDFLKTAGLGALAAGIGAACGPASGPAATGTPGATAAATGAPAATAAATPTVSSQKAVLRYLDQGNVFNDKDTAPLTKLIKEWQQLHPNLTIAVENYGFDNGHDKYATILKSGEVVDLAYGQAEWMPEFAELGALEPMEKWVDKSVIDDMFDEVRKACTWKGTVYMVPDVATLRLLIYRQDWLTEAGLSSLDTVDDVLTAAKAMHKPPDRYGFGTCISRIKNTVEFFLPFFWAFGGQFFDVEDQPKAVRFNDQHGIDALTYYVELCQYHQPGFETQNVLDVTSLFNEGKCGLQINDAKPITNIKPELKDKIKWGIAPPPQKVTRNAWAVIDVQYMFASGMHKQEVGDFWKLRYRPETVEEFLNYYATIPWSKSVAALPYYQNDPILKYFAQYGKYGRYLPKATVYAQTSDLLSIAIAKAVLGQATPKAALDEAATQVSANL
jgi:ABC-type glycerol-3-phosphate transport system substrate-binding protein